MTHKARIFKGDRYSEEMTMKIFRKRCQLMKKVGSIALRGGSAPSLVEHLRPIRPSPRWKSDIEESVLQDEMLAIGVFDDMDSSESEDESPSE
ncbi:Alternative oxidase 1, mitochondrial, partial [Frankliniella fusca]